MLEITRGRAFVLFTSYAQMNDVYQRLLGELEEKAEARLIDAVHVTDNRFACVLQSQQNMADDCVTVHLGYGRWRSGRVGNAAGFNAYAIRTSKAPWAAAGIEILQRSGRVALSCTQMQQTLEGRHVSLARSGDVEGRPGLPADALSSGSNGVSSGASSRAFAKKASARAVSGSRFVIRFTPR